MQDLTPSFDWPPDACLGRDLPAPAEEQLRLAGLAYHDDAVAEWNLFNAKRIAPDHPAVLIGLYRFYFYKGRLREALAVACICLEKAARDNGLAADWRAVRRADADFGNFEALQPRFYLFTLKGYAYLNMRLGNIDEGRAAALKLRKLDPDDKLGGSVLIGVLDRMGRDDDE